MGARRNKCSLARGISGALFAGAGLFTGPAHALVITENVALCELAGCEVVANAPGSGSGLASSLGLVPKFNPVLGNLTQVKFFFEITGNATLSADTSAEDNFTAPQDAEFSYEFSLELLGIPSVPSALLTDSGFLEGTALFQQSLHTLDTDQKIVSGPVAQPGGMVLADFIGNDTYSVRFAGTGNLTTTLDEPFDNATFTGSVSWFGTFADRGGKFTVEYIYDAREVNPIPEPGALALTSLSLLIGAGAFRRRLAKAI